MQPTKLDRILILNLLDRSTCSLPVSLTTPIIAHLYSIKMRKPSPLTFAGYTLPGDIRCLQTYLSLSSYSSPSPCSSSSSSTPTSTLPPRQHQHLNAQIRGVLETHHGTSLLSSPAHWTTFFSALSSLEMGDTHAVKTHIARLVAEHYGIGGWEECAGRELTLWGRGAVGGAGGVGASELGGLESSSSRARSYSSSGEDGDGVDGEGEEEEEEDDDDDDDDEEEDEEEMEMETEPEAEAEEEIDIETQIRSLADSAKLASKLASLRKQRERAADAWAVSLCRRVKAHKKKMGTWNKDWRHKYHDVPDEPVKSVYESPFWGVGEGEWSEGEVQGMRIRGMEYY